MTIKNEVEHSVDCICNSCITKKLNNPKYKAREEMRKRFKSWIETPEKIDEMIALYNAAPEMLTMLKDIETWLNTNLGLGLINAGTANRDGDLVSQIRATIAKAEGGK